MGSCKQAFGLNNTPAGRGVASRFPWWSTDYIDMPQNTAAGAEYWIGQRTQTGVPSFRNTTPKPVYITELRLWTKAQSLSQLDLQFFFSQMLLRWRTSQQGWATNMYVPAAAFNNVEDQHLWGRQNGVNYRLPAPYYLAHSNTFNIDLWASSQGANPYTIQASLRGCDPNNQSPIIVISDPSEPAGLPFNAEVQASAPSNLVFKDGRDNTVRNMWLHDMEFCLRRDQDQASLPFDWQNVFVRFMPPEGPKWTDDGFTPLQFLAEQVSAYWCGTTNIYYVAPVIHRPERPYILLPGDTLEMQIKWAGPTIEQSTDLEVWGGVKGWQEGGYRG